MASDSFSAISILAALFALQTSFTLSKILGASISVPSTSIKSNASAFSCNPSGKCSFTTSSEFLSINSIALGTILFLVISTTVLAASAMSVKNAESVETFSGIGRSFNIIFVIIPSVPSEPVISLVKS